MAEKESILPEPDGQQPGAERLQSEAEEPHAPVAEDGGAEARVAAAGIGAEVGPEFTETAKEAPMIDVHAPHGGIHTWRDFWIHLGTIALGLLIAIGLEQAVEWMHHLHQRHQLEADLRAELEANHGRLVDTRRRDDVLRARLVALRDEVNRVRDSGGRLKLAFIPVPTVDPQTKLPLPPGITPEETAWTTAKESEVVGLLPRNEAEVYSRLEIQYDTLMKVSDANYQSNSNLAAFEMRFKPSGIATDMPDMARMTVEDLNEYSILLSRALVSLNQVEYRERRFDQETEAILNGASSEQQLEKVLQEPLARQSP